MIIEIPQGYIFSKEGDIMAFEENGKLLKKNFSKLKTFKKDGFMFCQMVG